jgi:hypothetical protein
VDSAGNVVAVAVMAGDKKTWYQVVNGKVVTPTDANTGSYTLGEDITIIVDGQSITISAGNYQTDQIVCDENGNVTMIRITCGDYKLNIHFNSSGGIDRVEYLRTQNGIFIINNVEYDIYDIYGNVIGKFKNGQYYIYEIMYDQNGKVIAIRLSPDGEYEQWLYFNEYTKESDYSLFSKAQSNDKTSLSLFENNMGLFGLLGVLFVALGVTIAMKKRKKRKENQNIEDGNTNTWEKSSLSSGKYPIYEVKQNEEGVVTEARITPQNSEDEYWVEIR